MNVKDRKLLALRLLENPTHADLQEWFNQRLQNNLRDFLSVDPSNHGALAQAQGQIRETINYRDIRATLEREIKIMEDLEKNPSRSG